MGQDEFVFSIFKEELPGGEGGTCSLAAFRDAALGLQEAAGTVVLKPGDACAGADGERTARRLGTGHPRCPHTSAWLTPGCLSPQRSDPQLLAQFYYADEELNQVAAELDSLDGRKDPQRCTLLVSQFRSCQRSDPQLLAQFYYADEELNQVAAELDSLDGRKDPQRCTLLVSQFRSCQTWVAVRFSPRSLSLWCSYVSAMVPVKSPREYYVQQEVIVLFCETVERYVSAMVPVKSPREYYVQQEVIVLFCETVERALDCGYLTQDMIDDYEPALMFTIPRLAIVWNRELESMAMRPLAKELTRSLEDVRGALRDQALRDLNTYTEKMREALRHFDVLFAEFELR
ncbi:PREDICTED: lateral signaling target protein 2 homolog [Myotis brandtii]|uniref:lateral signaling target protein 2 homolog n=1 Tax=Myotis brandtii TaxID=109478 RepID=UPI0007042D48|nr:PREDICTED: lateral signaling target protein 2 homolog [Myotis brandtii]